MTRSLSFLFPPVQLSISSVIRRDPYSLSREGPVHFSLLDHQSKPLILSLFFKPLKKKIHIELEKIALTSHSLLSIKYLHWHHVIYKKEVNSCWILIECTKTCHFKRRGFTFYIQCVCMSVLLLLEYSSPPPV